VIFAFAGPGYCQDGLTRPALDSILDVLRRGHLTGSLEYRGRCGYQKEFVTRGFPIIATPKNPSAPPLQVLREMFADDEGMEVTQDPDGTIRMVEKSVPQDLLNVRIAHLSFDDEKVKEGPPFSFSPPLVLNFITGAPEVEAFMKTHSIGFEPRLINEPTQPKPHISGQLNNVTLSQALDQMAKTFRGLWVYKECPGTKGNQRIVDLWFNRYWE